MLDGEMDVVLGDRSIVLTPGTFVYIPAGTVHAFRYRTTGRFFSFTNGGMAARFFADLDQNAGEVPPILEKVLTVAARNEITVALPR
jgi:glyoxylate utilization-related uncharacterized protein